MSVALAGSLGLAVSAGPGELSFKDRVDAQEAIERAYHSHQIGAKEQLDEQLLRSIAARKVRTYLKQLVLLEKFWNTRITAEALSAEMRRIVRNTGLPDRLEQIYASLGNDSLLIQECFVRPILAERLSRRFFAFDERIHGETRRRAEALRDEVDSGMADARPTIVEIVLAHERRREHRSLDSTVQVTSAEEFQRHRMKWARRRGEASPLRQRREDFEFGVVLQEEADRFQVAHYSIPKTTWEEWWHSVADTLDEATVGVTAPAMIPPATSRSQPICGPDDVWETGALGVPAEGRKGHTAVWTGSEMLVWGGVDTFQASQTPIRGFRYDPFYRQLALHVHRQCAFGQIQAFGRVDRQRDDRVGGERHRVRCSAQGAATTH